MKKLQRFFAAFVICFVVHILVSLISSLIVNHFILNTRLANFTVYDGYADFWIILCYLPLSALLVFDKLKANAVFIAVSSFVVIVIVKAFFVDIINHYLRFYVKTQQNGSYNFEIFKYQITRQFDKILFEFSNRGQFFSTIIWIFIALLAICYLSLWAKKSSLFLNAKPLAFICSLLVLSSCNDNVQREKDKYPDIPEFPAFKQNTLAYEKLGLATVSYKDNQSAKVDGHHLVIHTSDYFYFAVADNALFIITGYQEAISPGNSYPAKNFVQLIKISDKKVLKLAWTDICDNDLPIFNDGKTLIVGSRIFNVNADQLTFTKVTEADDVSLSESTKVYSWDFSSKMISEDYKPYDSTFVKEFDRVTIGSNGHLSGGLNNGIDYIYDPVPMVYYQFNVGSKTGLTKINFNEQKAPLILKVAGKIYCITYNYDLKFRRKVQHYEIGVIE